MAVFAFCGITEAGDLDVNLENAVASISSLSVTEDGSGSDEYIKIIRPFIEKGDSLVPLLDDLTEGTTESKVQFVAKLVKRRIELKDRPTILEQNLLTSNYSPPRNKQVTAKGTPLFKEYDAPRIGLLLLHPDIHECVRKYPEIAEQLSAIRNWLETESGNQKKPHTAIQRELITKLTGLRGHFLGNPVPTQKGFGDDFSGASAKRWQEYAAKKKISRTYLRLMGFIDRIWIRHIGWNGRRSSFDQIRGHENFGFSL